MGDSRSNSVIGEFALLQIDQSWLYLISGVTNLGRLIKNNYTNIAHLKALTTMPPMTAERHAAILRKRIEHRRMVEEARELKSAIDPLFESR